MAIRIDEYSHIIRDGTSTPTNATNSIPTSGGDQLYVPDDASSLRLQVERKTSQDRQHRFVETSTPWYGGDSVFWTITMLLSLAVALIMSITVAPPVFEVDGSSSVFLGIHN